MKTFFRGQGLLMFAVAWLLAGPRVGAQGFGILLNNTPPPISLNGTFTYIFSVTNETGFNLPDFAVTNTFSANVSLLSFTNSDEIDSITATNANAIVFAFNGFTNAGVVTFAYTVQPLATGLLTNTIEVTTVTLTNTATTNVVTQVFASTSDLAVTIAGPAQMVVVTNDFTSYSVAVTNFGPQSVANVFFTNTLPPGVTLRGVSPASPGFSVSSNNLIFSLGTLASGAGQNFVFAIEPTNVATVTFSASVGAPNFQDTDTPNNFATTNINVISYLPGTFMTDTNSGPTVNLQNGTLQQSMMVGNVGVLDAPAVRVVVTGLTNQLFNAVGTNNGNPFFYLNAPLPIGQNADLLLQFFPRNAFPLSNTQIQAFAVPLPAWTPPRISVTSTNINIRRIVKLANGYVLLEFPTTLGRTYTIVYSDNISFSNALIAPPSVTAQANAVQWDDYGPPTTMSPPTSSGARFYRVFQNP